ncbi:unnamed protein product [Pedinophyceae sp. YPF-701]|nr:unnamed protein product [Pedinophyceae sp. YPF-701]
MEGAEAPAQADAGAGGAEQHDAKRETPAQAVNDDDEDLFGEREDDQGPGAAAHTSVGAPNTAGGSAADNARTDAGQHDASDHQAGGTKAAAEPSAQGQGAAAGGVPPVVKVRTAVHEPALEVNEVRVADERAAEQEARARASRYTLRATAQLDRLSPQVLSDGTRKRIRESEAKINDNCWDSAAWQDLLDAAAKLGTADADAVALQRAAHDELLALYPTAGRVWKAALELELAAGQLGRAIELCQRGLDSPHPELYGAYLALIRRLHESRGPEGVAEVCRTFEFCNARIGNDINAGAQWRAYVAFLQGPAQGTPEFEALFGSQELSARHAKLRRAFVSALQVPHGEIDRLWSEYEAFERDAWKDPSAARKQIDDMLPKVNHARAVYRERVRVYAKVSLNVLAVPPGASDPGDAARALRWKEVVRWERSNTQRLEGEALRRRVVLAYEQALLGLYRHAEVWYEYARWHMTDPAGKGHAEAVKVLGRGVEACPGCLALRYAMADVHEANGELAEARACYERAIAHVWGPDPKDLAAAETAARGGDAAAQERLAGLQAQARECGVSRGEFDPASGATCFVQFMHFLRRTEDIMKARKLFIEVKKRPNCPWQVYAAAAAMEARHNPAHDSVGVVNKIFEMGAQFLNDPGYVNTYAQWLVSRGDHVNARALFNRALDQAPAETLADLWDLRIALEAEFGNTDTCLQLEKQRAEELRARCDHKDDTDAQAFGVLMLRYKAAASWAAWPCSALERIHARRLLGFSSAPAERIVARGPPADPAQDRPAPARDAPAPAGAAQDRPRGGPKFDPSRPTPQERAAAALANPDLPPAVDKFLRLLPPGGSYDGPTLDVEMVIAALEQFTVPPPPGEPDAPAAMPPPSRKRRAPEAGFAPPPGRYGPPGEPPFDRRGPPPGYGDRGFDRGPPGPRDGPFPGRGPPPGDFDRRGPPPAYGDGYRGYDRGPPGPPGPGPVRRPRFA